MLVTALLIIASCGLVGIIALTLLFQHRMTLMHHLLLRYDERFRHWDDAFDRQGKATQNQEKVLIEKVSSIREQLLGGLSQQRAQLDKHQGAHLNQLLESTQRGFSELQQQITHTLRNHSEMLTEQVKILTKDTNTHLKDISGQVEKRLSEGFEKTTALFTDMVKRMAIIDEAQKKITELSTNVVSLQEILSDKKSRGTFGEVQLSNLIRNMLPEGNFKFQHTLSNGKRPDCLLLLPEPTGHVAVDAKFPLEYYRKVIDVKAAPSEHKAAEQQFRQVIKKHIDDIASKYILAEETAEGAVMFIPAEAVFAEIHSHYDDLVD